MTTAHERFDGDGHLAAAANPLAALGGRATGWAPVIEALRDEAQQQFHAAAASRTHRGTTAGDAPVAMGADETAMVERDALRAR